MAVVDLGGDDHCCRKLARVRLPCWSSDSQLGALAAFASRCSVVPSSGVVGGQGCLLVHSSSVLGDVAHENECAVALGQPAVVIAVLQLAARAVRGVDRSLHDWIRAQNTTIVMTASLCPLLAWTSTSCYHWEASQAAAIEIQSVSLSQAVVFLIGPGVLDFRENPRHKQSRKVSENLPVVNTILEALEDLEERQRGCWGLCHHYVIQHGGHNLLASSLTRSFSANSQDGVECDLMLWH